MRSLKDHGDAITGMIIVLVASLMEVSVGTMALIMFWAAVFSLYGKMHDILCVLKQQPQFSNCVINAKEMKYEPQNAITAIVKVDEEKDKDGK